MEVPRLKITYPGPDDPEYGTATTPYDLAALKVWAGQVTAYLEEREGVTVGLASAVAALAMEQPAAPEAPVAPRPARSRGARPAPTSADNDPDA